MSVQQNLFKKRILVVEDDALILELMKELLEIHNIEVVGFSEGAQALEWLRSSNTELPNLIFLDLMMPVMDGYEMMERMNEDANLAAIPVIALSADERGREKVRMTKAKAFFKKPVRIDILLGAIDRFVE